MGMQQLATANMAETTRNTFDCHHYRLSGLCSVANCDVTVSGLPFYTLNKTVCALAAGLWLAIAV